MFVELSKAQVKKKLAYINHYMNSSNAADGSKFDANANVTAKSIANMQVELYKDMNIQLNRTLIRERLKELYGEEFSLTYEEKLDKHLIYKNDETSIVEYCAAVTLYPFVTNGLKGLGGSSVAPKHLSSFCGGYVNLILGLSREVAGAVATVEFLMFFHYFALKDYGVNYLDTHTDIIIQELQQVVYAINQPNRNNNSPFTNWSVFDKHYFNSIFETFLYPDGTKPVYEELHKLQVFFMEWFNHERTKAVLTFPVITASCLNDGKTITDTNFKSFIAEQLSKGNAFFTFTSDKPYALSSCCRLLSEVDEQQEFSYSLGAGGVQAGSASVITINLPMLYYEWSLTNGSDFFEMLRQLVEDINKYQYALHTIYKERESLQLSPMYNHGFLSRSKQFLTVGFNGIVELAELFSLEAGNNDEYKTFASKVLSTINEQNMRQATELDIKINLEQIPAENVGVKFAKWNKEVGLDIRRDCQNSYMYKVEDDNLSILDKIQLHGRYLTDSCNGGSALHLNLQNYPTKEAIEKLLDVMVVEGCNYFCFNIKVTKCNSCGRIDKNTKQSCMYCGSNDIVHCTRVIGYLKEVSAFSTARQIEEAQRAYTQC